MPNQKKSPEKVENAVIENTVEQHNQPDQQAVDKQKTTEALQETQARQAVEEGLHADTFKEAVQKLEEKVKTDKLGDEERKKLYDEIVKKYDKSFVDKTKTVAENMADTMEMMDKVDNKWNIKNTLLWVGGATAVGWVASKWKSWFGKKEDKQSNSTETKDEKGNTIINVDAKEKKNRWQRNRGWVVGGAGAAGAAYYWRDKVNKIPVIGGWLDKLFNPQKVPFETAFTNFESDIKRGDVEKQFGIDPKISYEKIDDKKIKLKSYSKEIVIDIEKRIVDGMEDVVFPNYSELLHAANIINFSAAAFQGICHNSEPFKITKAGGDIEVKLLDSGDKEVVSGAGIPIGKIAGGTVAVLATIAGAVYGGGLPGGLAGAGVGVAAIGAGHMADTADALSQYCPTLNNEANKQKFRARLNKIPNLTQGNQEKKPDDTSLLHPELNKVIDEITATKTDSDFENQGNARQLDAIQDANNKNKYRIVSWSQETSVTLKDNKVMVDGLDMLFSMNEGIRIANLTNKIKRENAKAGSSKQPFRWRGAIESAGFPGLYMGTEEFNDNRTKWRRILTKDAIEKFYPNFKAYRDKYIEYLHTFKDENNNSLWSA